MKRKLIIHDYCGHPFSFDLSLELAKRGHEVKHIYTSGYRGPKAGFDNSGIESLAVKQIQSRLMNQKNLLYRRNREVQYGKKLIKEFEKEVPDLIISTNTPLDTLSVISDWSVSRKVPMVLWLQDMISIAMNEILTRKLGFLGKTIASYYNRIEKKYAKKADHIISITEDFNPYLLKWGVPKDKITVIPNWGPVDDIPMMDQNNSFSREHGLNGKYVILYAGTLGMKHNPDMIIYVADYFNNDRDVKVVVISEGAGIDHLEKKKEELKLKNLLLLPYQPYKRLPEILASSSIMLTILDKTAGIFSVPSKVWSGFCAGRPAILSVPKNNLAAMITRRYECGIVVDPDSRDELIDSMISLKNNKLLREKFGANARRYALEYFDISRISDQFESLIQFIIAERNQ
jgi:colanic acid biosynthesis glycosyl transferase WcaI